MALFSSKKNTEEKKKKEISSAVSPKNSITSSHTELFSVIRRPRITEKATMETEQNVYTFEVSPRANKKVIAQAIFELYNVKPAKVNVVPIHPKEVFVRGKRGMKSGGKKAYVFLKEGDKIEFT